MAGPELQHYMPHLEELVEVAKGAEGEGTAWKEWDQEMRDATAAFGKEVTFLLSPTFFTVFRSLELKRVWLEDTSATAYFS